MIADKSSDFYVRTSWANADAALAEINKGKAEGSRTAIWVRTRLQAELYHLGCIVQCHPGKVIFVALLLLASFCVGLKSAVIHSTVEQLWIEEGGNVEKELRYREVALGESATSTHQLLIQTGKSLEASVLHPSSLLKHVEIVKVAVSLKVKLFDITWELKDMCYSPNIPNFDEHFIDQIFEKIIPCAIITPLDCFWEGSKILGPEKPASIPVTIPGMEARLKWTNLNPKKLVETIKMVDGSSFSYETLERHMQRAGITTGYQEKPCLNPHDPECPDSAPNKSSGKVPNIGAELTGGCYGFATKYMHWPEELIIGGIKKNKTGYIQRAHALQTVVQLMGERELHEYWSETYKVHHMDWTQEKAALVLDTWQRSFSQEIQQIMLKENDSSSYNVYAFSTATLNDIMNQFSQVNMYKVAVGYITMLAYTSISLLRWNDPIRSQCAVGIAGIILVSFTVAAGLGFCAVLGIAFNASTTQIVPFLALGLGVDDVFLLTYTYAEQATIDTPPEEQTGVLLKRTGLSVMLTSLSNMCALFAAAIIPIPALRVFSLQSAVLVLFNLASALLVFPAIVSLDLRRRASGRYDVLCCCSPHTDNTAIPVQTRIQSRQNLQTGNCGSSSNKYCTVTVTAPKQPVPQKTKIIKNEENTNVRPIKDDTKIDLLAAVFNGTFTLALVGTVYSHTIMKPHMKFMSVVLFIFVIFVSVCGILRVTDGLDLTDIVPQATNEHAFLSAQGKYFGLYNMYAVTQGDFEYPTNQKLLYEFHEAFMRVQNIIRNDNGGLPEFWLSVFRDWLIGLQKAFDKDWKNGSITRERWFSNASDEGILAYKLLVQTGHVDNPIDKSLVTEVKLVDTEGYINPKAFYNYLSAWAANDALAYGASQGNLHPPPKEWFHVPKEFDLKIPKSAPLIYTQLPFYLHGLNDTVTITKMISQVREVCKQFENRGLPNFPSGIPFLFWEQYINLRQSLGLALAVALTSIFIVICLSLLNIWAAVLIIFVLAGMNLQLLGIIGALGIKLNAIPAVLLIIAVGIGVHYTIHMSFSFMTSIGDRQRRAQMAVEHMFTPVVQGAITTILAISVLAFSEFDFIVRYFFYILMALVGVGIVNGLIFLPVLLSFVGPEAEVIPLVHTNRISTPSPEPVCKVHQILYRGGAPPRRNTGMSKQCHREPSLTTITEEPSWHSTTQDTTKRDATRDTATHEIIVEPEFVVETTYSHPHVHGSNGDSTSFSQYSDTLNKQPHITTKVTATAKLKVEVHTPMSSLDSTGKPRRSRCNTDSSSSTDSENGSRHS